MWNKTKEKEKKKEKTTESKDPKMAMLMKRVFCPPLSASDFSSVPKLVLTIRSWFSFRSP